MSHVVCAYCGFYAYQTATHGVYKCSGCGELINLSEDEEDDDAE